MIQPQVEDLYMWNPRTLRIRYVQPDGRLNFRFIAVDKVPDNETLTVWQDGDAVVFRHYPATYMGPAGIFVVYRTTPGYEIALGLMLSWAMEGGRGLVQ